MNVIIDFFTNDKIATATTIAIGLMTIIGFIFSTKFRKIIIKTIFLFKIIKWVLPYCLVNLFEKKLSKEELRIYAKKLLSKGINNYYPKSIPGICDLRDYYYIDNDKTNGLYEALGFDTERRHIYCGSYTIDKIFKDIEDGKYDVTLKKFFKKRSNF